MNKITAKDARETSELMDRLTEHERSLIVRWFSGIAIDAVQNMLEYRYDIQYGADSYDPSFKEGYSTAYMIALDELEKIGRNLEDEVQG